MFNKSFSTASVALDAIGEEIRDLNGTEDTCLNSEYYLKAQIDLETIIGNLLSML